LELKEMMRGRHFSIGDEVRQVAKESRSIESDLDFLEIDESLLPGFVYSKSQRKIERRRHQRFKVDTFASALIRSATKKPIEILGRGMGEIACSVFRCKPAKLGRIHNISMGGLMFRYVDAKSQPCESLVMDILSADCGFYLENLRYRSVSDFLVPDDLPSDFIQMRQLHVEFDRLTDYQIDMLEYFIGEVALRSKRDSKK
jgi:hypothetical protein